MGYWTLTHLPVVIDNAAAKITVPVVLAAESLDPFSVEAIAALFASGLPASHAAVMERAELWHMAGAPNLFEDIDAFGIDANAQVFNGDPGVEVGTIDVLEPELEPTMQVTLLAARLCAWAVTGEAGKLPSAQARRSCVQRARQIAAAGTWGRDLSPEVERGVAALLVGAVCKWEDLAMDDLRAIPEGTGRAETSWVALMCALHAVMALDAAPCDPQKIVLIAGRG